MKAAFLVLSQARRGCHSLVTARPSAGFVAPSAKPVPYPLATPRSPRKTHAMASPAPSLPATIKRKGPDGRTRRHPVLAGPAVEAPGARHETASAAPNGARGFERVSAVPVAVAYSLTNDASLPPPAGLLNEGSHGRVETLGRTLGDRLHDVDRKRSVAQPLLAGELMKGVLGLLPETHHNGITNRGERLHSCSLPQHPEAGPVQVYIDRPSAL